MCTIQVILGQLVQAADTEPSGHMKFRTSHKVWVLGLLVATILCIVVMDRRDMVNAKRPQLRRIITQFNFAYYDHKK
jgi:hypothetical protein